MGFKLSDNFGPLRKNWIKGAIKRPGAFRKKAEEAGMSTKAFAEKVVANKDDYSARTGRQAELAETLMGMNMNESPAKMHTDKHMRRQAEKKARKTQGDAQDIYYEMKSDKMEKEKKKGSPAKKVTKEPEYIKRAKELAKGDPKKQARLIKAAEKQPKSSPAKMKSPAKKDHIGPLGKEKIEKKKKGKSSPAKLKKGSPAKGYKSDAQRKAVHASKADGGKGAPSKLKKDSPAEANKFMAALQAAKDKGEKSFVVNGKSYNVTSKK